MNIYALISLSSFRNCCGALLINQRGKYKMDYAGLVAGLGNPGRQYEGSRHNCGFMFVDALLRKAADEGTIEELHGKKFLARLWRITMPELSGCWLCAEPQTFMNDSGRAVRPLLSWFKLSPDQLVVVQDELDIPPGSLRFKFAGGLAGHNGLKSISRELGTQDYFRLRIGIGKPAIREEVLDWVLTRPPREECAKIESAISAAINVLCVFSREGGACATQIAHAFHPQ